MSKGRRKYREGEERLIAIMADEDTVTGFLLSGVGDIDARKNKNFLVVDARTSTSTIEEAFKKFTTRDDIAILLISQFVANEIRYLLNEYKQTIPTILEIPSKEHPYDPAQDTVMQRVKLLFGES